MRAFRTQPAASSQSIAAAIDRSDLSWSELAVVREEAITRGFLDTELPREVGVTLSKPVTHM